MERAIALICVGLVCVLALICASGCQSAGGDARQVGIDAAILKMPERIERMKAKIDGEINPQLRFISDDYRAGRDAIKNDGKLIIGIISAIFVGLNGLGYLLFKAIWRLSPHAGRAIVAPLKAARRKFREAPRAILTNAVQVIPTDKRKRK